MPEITTETELLEGLTESYLQIVRSDIAQKFDCCLGICQSPIERVFLAAMLIGMSAPTSWETCHWDTRPGLDIDLVDEPFAGTFGYIQAAVGPYKADFVVTTTYVENQRLKFAIECDGHDFHEKTKQQAQHDKKRDRYFQRKGFRVLRFTGSEIWRDPIACTEEVVGTIYSYPDQIQ